MYNNHIMAFTQPDSQYLNDQMSTEVLEYPPTIFECVNEVAV